MRTIKKLLFLLIIVSLILAFLPALVTPFLKKMIEHTLNDYFKTDVSIGDVSISPLSKSIVIHNLSVKNKGQSGRANLFESENVFIYPELLSFIAGKFVISITIDKPILRFHKNSAGKSNWDFFKNSQEKKNSPKSPYIDKVLVKNGVFQYSKKYTLNKIAIAQFQGIFLFLKNHSSPIANTDTVPLYTAVKGRGYIPAGEKGLIEFSGSANLFENEPSFTGAINLKDISLTYFNDFYPENSPIEVTDGAFSLTTEIKCVKNNLSAKPNVTVNNLRFKLIRNYSSGKVFNLPVVLVVDFFDIYEKEIKFSFEIKGSLSNPEFDLENVITQKVSQVIGESIARSIVKSPKLALKLGKKIKDLPEIIKYFVTAGGNNLKKAVTK